MRYVGQGIAVASAVGLSAAVLCPAGAQAQVSTTYTHDALGCLKTVTNAGGATVTYAYDAAGNRSQVVVAGGQTALPIFDQAALSMAATAGAFVVNDLKASLGFVDPVALFVEEENFGSTASIGNQNVRRKISLRPLVISLLFI